MTKAICDEHLILLMLYKGRSCQMTTAWICCKLSREHQNGFVLGRGGGVGEEQAQHHAGHVICVLHHRYQHTAIQPLIVHASQERRVGHLWCMACYSRYWQERKGNSVGVACSESGELGIYCKSKRQRVEKSKACIRREQGLKRELWATALNELSISRTGRSERSETSQAI